MQQPSLRKQSSGVAKEWLNALIIAVILAVILRAFVIHPYKIPSSSMEDTLLRGDHILATKFNYGLTVPFTTIKFLGGDIVPKRGDVIIFTYPKDHTLDYVKRVIGLPGETVQVKNKRVLINGREFIHGHAKFTDSFLLPSSMSSNRDNYGPVVIKPGHVFVMGDNRDHSADSRVWGQLPIQNIKGKAFIIYFSWDPDTGSPRWGRLGNIIR